MLMGSPPGTTSAGELLEGLMQPRPLTVAHIFERLEHLFSHKTVVSGTERLEYGELADNGRRLATVLDQLGVPAGARVATFASNNRRHLEIYLAVPATKRVLHTVNIRLAGEDLEYIVNHAADDVIFVDRALLPRIWPRAAGMPTIRHWVVLPDDSGTEIPEDPRILDYDVLLSGAQPRLGSFEDAFRLEEENLAAGLCYTSGTTGKPKGVMYSHRSTVLHTLGTLAAGQIGITERDVVMPVVPMFHANAWGLPYGAMMAGANLVMPGASAEPRHLVDLMESQRVTLSGAVPTVWTSLLPELAGRDLSSVRLLLGGGSAISSSLSEAYRAAIGVPITHSWGMTEVSPVGCIGGTRTQHDGATPDDQIAIRAAQGQPMPLVRLRVVDPQGTGRELPRDGRSIGELQVSGPWVAGGYYKGESPDSFSEDGWLRTGDLTTIDSDGYLRVVDRLKDLIKSGGEWISSVELESAIITLPDVEEVAVVARPHPRWGERPVAYVVLREGSAVTPDDVVAHLATVVAKWWIPDEVIVSTSLPKTGSGKLAKAVLRESARRL
jgi:fatty-acyl-CoA synthase